MAFSPALADRVRHAFGRRAGVEEKRMFGGLAFLVDGHLAVGVWTDRLMARLGVEAASEALRDDPAVEPFRNGQRVMAGWVVVTGDGFENDEQLRGWVDRSLRFVDGLPPKPDSR